MNVRRTELQSQKLSDGGEGHEGRDGGEESDSEDFAHQVGDRDLF